MAEPLQEITLAGRTVSLTGDPNDPYFTNLQAFHRGSPQLDRYAAHHLRRDALCIDAGANIGLTSLLLSLSCPDGHVFAFEALPGTARYLRRNLERNGITNCTVVETALGAYGGELAFTESGAGSHAVTEAHMQAATRSTVRVPVTTLDAFADQHLRGRRVDFIKMDVEGFEPAVIEGGARLIERDRPPLFIEFNAWSLAFAQGFDPFDFARCLWDAFDAFQVGEGGDLVPADRDGFLYAAMVQRGCVDDLLLRLKPGAAVPLARQASRTAREGQLRAELDAVRRSTSWRVTAPLRALKEAFGGARSR